ncbi:MAG: hypothetical protein Q7I99_04990 [Acholeplasmataceae bacterium]|nr:hypothetical protein [Acholeplasmataceae bacterium]
MNNPATNEVQSSKPITLKDIIMIVWNRKFLLMIACFIGLVVTVIGGIIFNSTNSKISTIVEFQWSGITAGEYPDGKRFDYTNIFESYIFAEAIAELSIENATTNEMRSNIKVAPIIPGNVYDLIEAELLRGNQITYFPNVFSISVNHSKLGLSKTEGAQLLSLLIDKYRVDFEKKYIERAVVVDFTKVSLENYDYSEAHQILESQVILIENAVDRVLPLGSSFVSTQLGIGFNDIIVRTQLISNIELRSISARINNYLLTKDVTLTVTRYRYDIERLELDLAKYHAIETGLDTLITNYIGSTAIIIIPGLDMDDIKVEPYLSTLYAKLVDVKSKIANAEQDVAYYEIRIDRLLGNDPLFIITPEQVVTETAIVEDSIQSTNLILSKVVEDMQILLEEYNQYVIQSQIRPVMAPQYVARINLMIFAIVGIALGGSIGLAYVFINYQKKQND